MILFAYELHNTGNYYCLVFENLRLRISTWISVIVYFFRTLTYHCLLIVGGEGYCFIGSHSRTHTQTRARARSVGLLWTSDRPIADIYL
jgi:hypothetical protein